MKIIKFTLEIILLFFLVSPTYGQLSALYKSEIKKRLDPEVDTTTTKVVALYIMRPAFNTPESSIRVVDINSKSFIEARIFSKNIWKVLISRSTETTESVVTNYFSEPISKSFRDKISLSFSKVIEINKPVIDSTMIKIKSGQSVRIRIYDGPIYEFKVNNNETIKYSVIERDLTINDLDYKVSETCNQILNDLKNGTFKESNYGIYQ